MVLAGGFLPEYQMWGFKEIETVYAGVQLVEISELMYPNVGLMYPVQPVVGLWSLLRKLL
ncbi:MAG: hypothetical protein DWQ07_16060 [Chloroflexi bacterium]|nr:MAG: hypothetical protein DWQ07_16060 [Chloroflexota bacterium]MBL1195266.1 hypothetical protein [Chloroflexota bacterium]